MLGDFVATFEQAGNQEIFGIGVTQDDAGTIRGRDHADAVALLFVAYGRIFPKLGGGLFQGFGSWATHGEIGIVSCAAAGGTRRAVAAQAAEPATASDAAERKDRAVVAVGGG